MSTAAIVSAVCAVERLGDSGRRGAFLNTVRAVIDGHGQKVSALDRLHLMPRSLCSSCGARTTA